MISHKFHFHPGNPETLQSVKTVTANVPQIKKVTTACQVAFATALHCIKAMFLTTESDMFFCPLDIEL